MANKQINQYQITNMKQTFEYSNSEQDTFLKTYISAMQKPIKRFVFIGNNKNSQRRAFHELPRAKAKC